MIDTSKAEWEFSDIEKHAIAYFNDNGYDGRIVKQYRSKTVFEISKDGFNFGKFETTNIPMGIKQRREYMEQFEKSFAIAKKIYDIQG